MLRCELRSTNASSKPVKEKGKVSVGFKFVTKLIERLHCVVLQAKQSEWSATRRGWLTSGWGRRQQSQSKCWWKIPPFVVFLWISGWNFFRLKELLRTRLIECGWRDQLRAYCKGQEVFCSRGRVCTQAWLKCSIHTDLRPFARASSLYHWRKSLVPTFADQYLEIHWLDFCRCGASQRIGAHGSRWLGRWNYAQGQRWELCDPVQVTFVLRNMCTTAAGQNVSAALSLSWAFSFTQFLFHMFSTSFVMCTNSLSDFSFGPRPSEEGIAGKNSHILGSENQYLSKIGNTACDCVEEYEALSTSDARCMLTWHANLNSTDLNTG